MAVLRWSDLTTLTTPDGVLTFNEATGDTYLVDPARSSPLGAGETRAVIDDRGQTDGFLIHNHFEKGALLVIGGVVFAPSDTSGTTGADALMADMVDKCRSILRADGTLAFGSGSSLTVRCHMLPTFPPFSGIVKGFLFGVVSADPPP